MLKKLINQTNYKHSAEMNNGDCQAPQIPDHIKCGEVFTWLCAGELYAVECKLCEDCPLCPLSEFPQHMDIWHTEWQIATPKHETKNEQVHFTDDDDDHHHYEQQQNSLTNNNDCVRGLEPGHELQSDRITSQQQTEDILEPFEQVLIEQNISTQAIHINENANEEEYVEDAHLPAADNKQYQIENKQKLAVNKNPALELIINEQRAGKNTRTANERESRYLTEHEAEMNVNVTKDLSKKHKIFKAYFKGKNTKGKFWRKPRNYKRNFRNFNNKTQATSDSGSDSEMRDEENFESKDLFNRSGQITKSIEKNLAKIEKIKNSLSKIVRNMNDNKRNNILTKIRKLEKETTENETETSGIEKGTKENETRQMEYETGQTAKQQSAIIKETSKEIFKFKSTNTEAVEMPQQIEIADMKNSLKIKTNNLNQNRKYAKKLRKITEIKGKTNKNTTYTSDNETNETETCASETDIKRAQTIANLIKSKIELNGDVSQLINSLMPNPNTKTQECCNKIKFVESENGTTEIETELNHNERQTKIYTNKNKRGISPASHKNKTILITNRIGIHGNAILEQEHVASENKINNNEDIKFEECMKKSLETRKKVEKYLQKTARSRKRFQQKMQINETSVTERNGKETAGYETQNPKFFDCLQNSFEIKGKSKNTRATNENETRIKEEENSVNETESQAIVNVVETSGTETSYAAHLECLQNTLEKRKRLDEILKKTNKTKMHSKENEEHNKNLVKRLEKQSQEIENVEQDKSLKSKNSQNLRRTRKSLRILRKNFTHSQNFKHSIEKELQLQGINEIEGERKIRKTRQQDKRKLRDNERNNDIGLKKNILQQSKNSKTLQKKHLPDANKVNEFKRKLRNYEKERNDLAHHSSKRLRNCSFKRIKKRQQTHWKRCANQKSLKAREGGRKGSVKESHNITNNLLINSETNEIHPLLEMKTLCHKEKNKDFATLKENMTNVQCKEKVNGSVSQNEQKEIASSSPKEDNGKVIKQTLVTQFFSKFCGNSEKLEYRATFDQLNLQEENERSDKGTRQEGASKNSKNYYKLKYSRNCDQESSSGRGTQDSVNSKKLKDTTTFDRLNLQPSSSDKESCTTLIMPQQGVPMSSENSFQLELTSTSDQLKLQRSFSAKSSCTALSTLEAGVSKNSNNFGNHKHNATSDNLNLQEGFLEGVSKNPDKCSLQWCSSIKGSCPTPSTQQEEASKNSDNFGELKHNASSNQLNLHESFPEAVSKNSEQLSLQLSVSDRDSCTALSKRQEGSSSNSPKPGPNATSNQLYLQKSSPDSTNLIIQPDAIPKSSENPQRPEYNSTRDQLNLPETCPSKYNLTALITLQEILPRGSENSDKQEYSITSDHLNLQKSASSKDNCSNPSTEPSSPRLSAKTEEDHSEFYEPKEKLNRQHISQLIKLYREHPRLWDQLHPEFCEPHVCRKSWHTITQQWNVFCKRNFTTAEVRIRICTLCQSFLKERDRLAAEGEVDECGKFPYYEEMQFLEQQKSLQKRRELYDQQNEKILEIYQNFPTLWHVNFYKLTKAAARDQAIESISKTLKLFDINLSCMAIQKRLRSLRKYYRLEKIRYLHAQVEQIPFECAFRHYERMHFLDKHIEPFVCRICGKIFENLQSFRQHLEAEGHGSVLMEESEDKVPAAAAAEININEEACLSHIQENNLEDIETEAFIFSPTTTNNMHSFSESEDSRDILQRFTPFSSSPVPTPNSITNSQLPASETACSMVQEVVYFPLDAPNEQIINSLHLEEQLIEEIMENVSNHDILSQQGLDQFINTVTRSCEGSLDFELTAKNCVAEETFSPHLFHTENSFVVEHPDIVADQSPSILHLSPIVESFTPLQLYSENSFIIEHPDIVTDENVSFLNGQTTVESVVSDENSVVVEHSNAAIDNVIDMDADQSLKVSNSYSSVPETCPLNDFEDVITKLCATENLSSPAPLMAKMQCSDLSIDLKLNSKPTETLNCSLNDMDTSSADISTIPLPDHLIHKMIEVYRKYPLLWNPNHLDFNSRTLRRQAWCSLTAEFNTAMGKGISWRTLHRKLTDYAKYYKKLITEQEDYEKVANKWAFYEDFKFMDDVIAINNELQRSIYHRDSNFKIIGIYKTLPQLWNTQHPDYNKRGNKQRNIEIMCNKLQEENNLQFTTERVKHRLIELRTQYRTAKKQRLKCFKNKQTFSPNHFEYYEALNFLDDHIDPFTCDICKTEFRKRTDYKQHVKKEHTQKNGLNKRPTILPLEPDMENICHICGIKFTTRSNLRHHLRRHEGIQNYACTMCPKKFYASYTLKVHIRSHTKECPYSCEKCGMSFVSASKLNQHVKRHLNKKDFQCEFCAKAFFTAFEKDRHEKRHLNIRDKSCPVCGKSFVAGSSYYAHLMLHDDTKRFECDKCNTKFAQYAGLYKHRKRHHI